MKVLLSEGELNVHSFSCLRHCCNKSSEPFSVTSTAGLSPSVSLQRGIYMTWFTVVTRCLWFRKIQLTGFSLEQQSLNWCRWVSCSGFLIVITMTDQRPAQSDPPLALWHLLQAPFLQNEGWIDPTDSVPWFFCTFQDIKKYFNSLQVRSNGSISLDAKSSFYCGFNTWQYKTSWGYSSCCDLPPYK